MVVNFTDGTTTDVVTTEITPNSGIKVIQVRVPATFIWGTDAIIVDLSDYGATKVAGVLAFEETTAGSVVVAATAGTTIVASNVLTYTSAGSGTNGGTIQIFAY